MSAVDSLLARLDNPRPNGRDRWRCACPVCGERNRSTLSIGVGDNGCVLLKCWKEGCGPEQIANAVGLELEDLFPPREHSASPLKRRRLITANQALELLDDEMTLMFVCGSDMARGQALDEPTRERLMVAAARIGMLRQEVRS
ncbi:hypothetical protein [Piscinibacter koreensis]|uniref:DNA primase n=1 Tax=Piscinibacter koreensis TaxID=2742824 RepID=A0A7Y6NQU8_9BURK|nr:hypothetical protein [Schlegelella koreensis]NUZ07650.1 hypothetical protein [Schlegelella koreensis]